MQPQHCLRAAALGLPGKAAGSPGPERGSTLPPPHRPAVRVQSVLGPVAADAWVGQGAALLQAPEQAKARLEAAQGPLHLACEWQDQHTY